MIFTVAELSTIIDALAFAAARRETQAGYYNKYGQHHYDIAVEIHALRIRFLKQRLKQSTQDVEPSTAEK